MKSMDKKPREGRHRPDENGEDNRISVANNCRDRLPPRIVADNEPAPRSRLVTRRHAEKTVPGSSCCPQAHQFDACQWERIFNTVGSGLRVIDLDGWVLHVNDAFCQFAGISYGEAVNHACHESFLGSVCNTDSCPMRRIIDSEERIDCESSRQVADGSTRYCIISASPLRDEEGNLIGIIEDFRDITEHRRTEEALIHYRDHLQGLVAQQTAELSAVNESLKKEITEREVAAQELTGANNELEIERVLLQNKNIALRELMDQIDQQKQQTNRHLQANVNRVVLPMLQLINDKLRQDDQHLVKLLESALTDLMDPTTSNLERLHSSLSPREIEVCNMIRRGFSSKQMASILNVSVHTINNQRRSIRRKLRINDNQTNLETYLKSL